MKSIKSKLVVYITVLTLLVAVSVAFIALRTANNAVVEEVETALEIQAQEAAKLTESRIETGVMALEMIAGRSDIISMDYDEQQPVLQRNLERTDFLAIAVVHPDGTAYYSDGTTAQLGDREYIRRAFDGEINVSDLIISRVTNQAVFMYAAPIENNGEIVGALIGRRDASALTRITDDLGFGDTGYAYMINNNGDIIAHRDREMVTNQWNPIKESESDESLSSLGDFLNTVILDEVGVSRYSFEDEILFSGYAPVSGTNWYMIINATEDEVLAALPRMQRGIAFTTLIILVISSIVCYLIGNSIVNPISLAIKQADKIANLNITDDVPDAYINRKDEIGSLSKAFQTIIDSLREFINQVGGISEQVASSSEELTAISNQSATAADEVAKSIEEIAKGANEQAKDTENGVSKAAELSSIIEEDLEDMKKVERAIEELIVIKNEGTQAIGELITSTKDSDQSVKIIYESTLETNESAEKIGEASKLIEQIAEQTNLLALNAAIESARAGEAGKGFAVVAEEIRILAEQSANSAKEIDNMLKKLQDNSKNAVNVMQNVLNIIKEQVTRVEVTGSKFESMADHVGEVKTTIDKSMGSVGTMDSLKHELGYIMENLSAIAEENAAGTEQASASVEEQTASIEEIASSSEVLAKLADDMQKSIAKFKL